MKCRICENYKNNKEYEVKEMMLGLREKFTYFQCSECECLQIASIPVNMSKYYPKDYYSFSTKAQNSKTKFKNLFKKIYFLIIFDETFLGRAITRVFPLQWLKRDKLVNFPKKDYRDLLPKKSRILDVGCGKGHLLYILKMAGFNNLLGVDPYLDADIQYPNGLMILKKKIHNLNVQFDFIMFHHSFEHVSDPAETMKNVSRLLVKEGSCLLRIPTVNSFVWENYRENWVELDAPRHFFIHSIKSIEMLAQKCGLKVRKVVCDSTIFELWGSEQYKRDIPLNDGKSYCVNRTKSIFDNKAISEFQVKVNKLNQECRGGRSAFYLEKQ